jgi:hypothetical protein
MPTETVILFAVLAIGGFLFFAVAIAALALFFRALVRGARSNPALQGTAEEHLAAAVPALLPWRTEALADLSSHLEMVGYSALGELHYRGAFKSLSQPQATGWLAFDLHLKRAKGPVMVSTSAHACRLDVEWRTAQVTVDGQLLGRIQTQGLEVTLLDLENRPIGHYHRQRQRFWNDVNVGRQGFFEPAYGPVMVHDRTLAEINSNPVRSQHLARLDRPLPAMIQNLVPSLTPEEEAWLVALVGLEIYYRITRYLNSRTRRRLRRR